MKHTFTSIVSWVRHQPKRYTIPAVILLLSSLLYVIAFVVEKPVVLSYAEKTCASRLVVLPTIHKVSKDAHFKISHTKVLKVGTATLVASDVCFTPVQAPKPGVDKVRLAPFGGGIARQTFAVTIPSPVVADVQVLDKPIPTSKRLQLNLSGPDVIFSYSFSANDKKVGCVTKATTLSCDIARLKLDQSRDYTATLSRQFDGKAVSTVLTKDIQTLSATTVTDASIKPGSIIYDKPKEFSISFDKKVIAAKASIIQVEGETRTNFTSTTEVTDTGVTVKIFEELPRSKDFELRIDEVEAVDGSGLVEPHSIAMKTSGGPKVSKVSVGTTGVPIGSTIAITFDQPLSTTQDISKFITVSGGASFVGKRGDQLLVSVAGVARCGDFSIKLSNDIQSNYDIGGQSAWSFSGRTVCHTIGTFGYSAQGRPMNAYYFGTGGTTVMYTGAIHGSEASTKYLMDQWIQELEAKARTIPAHISVVVVPIINPDGFSRGNRTNANNVDLNRNFATNDWQKDITDTSNQPFAGGGGEMPMSEPESKAIAALAQRLRPKVILSYHSIGGVVAANQAGNSSAWAATYSRLSGYRNITGQSSGTFEYAISGTADDYYAEKLGVPSILIELGSHSSAQFSRNQAAMWAMIHE